MDHAGCDQEVGTRCSQSRRAVKASHMHQGQGRDGLAKRLLSHWLLLRLQRLLRTKP